MMESIRNVLMLAQVESDLLESYIQRGLISVRNYKKNEVVLHQDIPYENLYGISKGICYSNMVDISGKSMKIDDFYSGEVLATGVLFSCDNRMPVSVFARSNCEIVIIQKKAVLELCMHSEGFLLELMRLISDKVTFLTKKLLFISFKSIKTKFAGYLASKMRDDKNIVIIDQSLEELATYFGVARPSLSRVIGEMEADGVFSHERNIYTIHDKKMLFAYNE